MRLLLDQNLSRHLVPQIDVTFPESRHVTEVGLQTATDREIWSYAGEHGFIIVSKDSDFRQLAFLLGPPPKAVWLSLGNASTLEVLELLMAHVPTIEDFARSTDEALLVLSERPTSP